MLEGAGKPSGKGSCPGRWVEDEQQLVNIGQSGVRVVLVLVINSAKLTRLAKIYENNIFKNPSSISETYSAHNTDILL